MTEVSEKGKPGDLFSYTSNNGGGCLYTPRAKGGCKLENWSGWTVHRNEIDSYLTIKEHVTLEIAKHYRTEILNHLGDQDIVGLKGGLMYGKNAHSSFGGKISRYTRDTSKFLIIDYGPCGCQAHDGHSWCESTILFWYDCITVPWCKQWPGGCCGTYGNCETDDRGFTKYLGCSSSASRCERIRTEIKSNDVASKVCSANEGLFKAGKWFGATTLLDLN